MKTFTIVPMHSFSAAEIIRHWLLNTTVECEAPVPLIYLFPEVSQALNVKPVPGCGSNDYANGLIDLFDSGMITFSSKVEGDDTRDRTGISRLLERFRTLSKDDSTLRGEDGIPRKSYERRRLPGMQVSFELTALGGEAWEKIAEPDWARYVSTSTIFSPYGDPSPAVGDVISADRDLVIAYMGWYPQVNGEQIQLETIRWQTHTDFEILYWKRLPFVHHASFRVRTVEERWGEGQPKWFRDWWLSTR